MKDEDALANEAETIDFKTEKGVVCIGIKEEKKNSRFGGGAV